MLLLKRDMKVRAADSDRARILRLRSKKTHAEDRAPIHKAMLRQLHEIMASMVLAKVAAADGGGGARGRLDSRQPSASSIKPFTRIIVVIMISIDTAIIIITITIFIIITVIVIFAIIIATSTIPIGDVIIAIIIIDIIAIIAGAVG